MTWVNHTYLKRQSLCEHNPPVHSSWAWKKLCKIRGLFIVAYNGDAESKSASGVYTVRYRYELLHDNQEKVLGSKWVWNNVNIPKHCMIAWLVCLDKIKTRSKLFQIGFLNLICAQCVMNNLRLQCTYSLIVSIAEGA